MFPSDHHLLFVLIFTGFTKPPSCSHSHHPKSNNSLENSEHPELEEKASCYNSKINITKNLHFMLKIFQLNIYSKWLLWNTILWYRILFKSSSLNTWKSNSSPNHLFFFFNFKYLLSQSFAMYPIGWYEIAILHAGKKEPSYTAAGNVK
jgi:hypothetical protein